MAMRQPYLMFLGDAADDLAAKTAQGVVHWRREACLGQLRLPGCRADVGLPDMTVAQAARAGCGTMLVGVANSGGFIPAHWSDTIVAALAAGMDVASGLHQRLSDLPAVAAAAKQFGRNLIDVRHPTQEFATGKGRRRSGKRLLAVGTDCSVGKMYTTLALEKEMRARGINADFRATGQTGIFIAGSGVSIDAVVADFISGAVEWLCPDNEPEHWDLIEGQGSLFHASYAGVSLGLLHGACPDALVLCHEPTRTHMRGLAHYPLPALATCLEANLAAARLVNPGVKCVGVSINTAKLDAAAREDLFRQTATELGLPVVDPVVTGVGPIVDRLVAS